MKEKGRRKKEVYIWGLGTQLKTSDPKNDPGY
jgi:hypothetical protein